MLLQSRASDLKTEVRALLLSHGVKNMRVVPVKRKYAFEDPAIPHGEQWVLKVSVTKEDLASERLARDERQLALPACQHEEQELDLGACERA